MTNPSESPARTQFDALVATFAAIYGASKVRAMWEGTRKGIVAGVWNGALARYRPAAVELAARDLADLRDEDGRRKEWPPTLPEFLDIVEAHDRTIRRSETLALPDHRAQEPSSPLMSREKARAALAELAKLGNSKRVH